MNKYVPPPYIPLGHSDFVSDAEEQELHQTATDGTTTQWSSGLCACFDDMQSCCIGLVCPCYLFGQNAQFLGSGTMLGSCTTHFVLCALMNTLCCFLTDGILFGLPGCFVSCYACAYRKQLRSMYNLQERPCGDLVTHMFCHLCAICQEYREIRDRTNLNGSGIDLAVVTAPPAQTMESVSYTQ